jgi:hypothetical protein
VYTAFQSTEWKQIAGVAGVLYGGVNGRRWVKFPCAFTVNPEGRKIRAFTDREGGWVAAQKWADILNEKEHLSFVASPVFTMTFKKTNST